MLNSAYILVPEICKISDTLCRNKVYYSVLEEYLNKNHVTIILLYMSSLKFRISLKQLRIVLSNSNKSGYIVDGSVIDKVVEMIDGQLKAADFESFPKTYKYRSVRELFSYYNNVYCRSTLSFSISLLAMICVVLAVYMMWVNTLFIYLSLIPLGVGLFSIATWYFYSPLRYFRTLYRLAPKFNIQENKKYFVNGLAYDYRNFSSGLFKVLKMMAELPSIDADGVKELTDILVKNRMDGGEIFETLSSQLDSVVIYIQKYHSREYNNLLSDELKLIDSKDIL